MATPPAAKRPRRHAPEQGGGDDMDIVETVAPGQELPTSDEMRRAFERFRAQSGPHYFPDPLLQPANWVGGHLPRNQSVHWSSIAALRMLWSWVRLDAQRLLPSQLEGKDLVRDWLAERRAAKDDDPMPTIDTLLNQHLIIERTIATTESVNQPGLFLARLRDSAAWHMTAESSAVTIKYQPFFTSIREYEEIVDTAQQMEKDQNGTVSVYDRLLSFTVDVLNGMWLRDVVLRDRVTLTPHFAIVLDAFALPMVEQEGDRLRPRQMVAGRPRPIGLYQLTERGDMTLAQFIKRDDVYHPQVLQSCLWQTSFTVYVAAVRDGLEHRDLHVGNIMIRSVVGTPYANRHWMYMLPGERIMVVPREMHQNWFVEVIDYGRSLIHGTMAPWPEIERGIRSDLQKAFHGNITDRNDVYNYDPSTLDPDDDIQPEGSNYHGSSVGMNLRIALLAATRELTIGQEPLHQWYKWLRPWLWPEAVMPVASLAALARVYPNPEDFIIVGSLPVRPDRPSGMDPTQGEGQAPKRGREDFAVCSHCQWGPGQFKEQGTARLYCSRLCQALAAGIFPTAPVLGHWKTM